MDRRDFLKIFAASTAFSMINPLGSMAGESIKRPLRVGFIGTGNRGTSVVTAMSRSCNVEIFALADLFRDRIDGVLAKLNDLNGAKGMEPIKEDNIYVGRNAYKQLLKDKSIDIVVIGTPSYVHPEIMEAAIKAHKHVYCEKPAAPDVDGTLHMMKVARGVKDLSLTLGFQVRTSPAYDEMIRRIHDGQIGEVMSAQLYYNCNGGSGVRPAVEDEEFRIRNHFRFLKTSGGILTDQGIHIIDICNCVLKANPIFAIGLGNQKGRNYEFGDTLSNYHVVYRYPNDVNVSMQSLQIGPRFGDVCARFFGSKGVAEAHYSGGVHIKGETRWDSGVQHALAGSDETKAKLFVDSIISCQYINTIEQDCNSTLAAILGREAVMKGQQLSWDDMIKERQRYERVDLSKF